MKIKSIRKAERAEITVDMEVANTHSYQLENGAVVHNTISKLFGLTEGWHLPSMRWYLRWVQYRNDDPLVEIYAAKGYPTRKLVQYEGTTIVGFPTEPVIMGLKGITEHVVTAAEATPEEQYKWLMLGEKYWIRGVDESGEPLKHDYGNQISYCLAGGKKHLITTDKGLQRIENVISSNTIDRDGIERNIIDLVDNGVKPTFDITLKNGVHLVPTGMHRMLTVLDDLSFDWKMTHDIKEGDIIVRRIGDNIFPEEYYKLPPIKNGRSDNKNGNVKLVHIPRYCNTDFALFLGMHLSDGHLGKNGVFLTTADYDVAEKYVVLVKKLFGLDTKVKCSKRHPNVISLITNSRPLARWIYSITGVRYHYENFVPDCVLMSPREIQEQFIRGYTLDGHASKQKGLVHICTTVSYVMANDISAMLWNMGYDASISKKKGRPFYFSETNNGMGRDQYIVYLGNDDSKKFVREIGFLEERKNEIVRKHNIGKSDITKDNAIPLAGVLNALNNDPDQNFDHRSVRQIFERNKYLVSIGVIQKYLSEVKALKKFLDPKLRFTRVKSVDIGEEVHTFDISVADTHEYLANGCVVHNTLKYKPKITGFNEFTEMLLKYQSRIRCCSVMPQEESVSYEYQPEEPVTKAQFEGVVKRLEAVVASETKSTDVSEDIDFVHIDCAGGACPIDFTKDENG